MDLTKLQELIDEYLETVDDWDDFEVMATEKRLAEEQLAAFMTWLKGRLETV